MWFDVELIGRREEALVFMAQPEGSPVPIRLKVDKGLQPCPTGPGDEIYPNGVFEFNITRLLAFVREHTNQFPVEWNAVSEIPHYGSFNLNEDAVRAADLSCPILLAEMTPGQYGLIDGHHRLAKARRQGALALPAHRLLCPVQVPFLTPAFAYERYVEYWNDKVAAWERYGGSRRIPQRRG